MNETNPVPTEPAQPKWQPLNSRQRRVVGVLVEKAKTTPDAYPMTLNALTTGCNQKNNRSPLTNYTPDDVQQAIDGLREMGVVIEVQGSGRVPKFRHQMYEWLGVDKVELAVMAELLLRGEQTVGELRTRAARMEPIPGLPELKPVLQSLIDKKLVISLTPEGRGQMVTHNLYKERELEEIKARVAAHAPAAGVSAEEPTAPVPSAGLTSAWSYVSQDKFEQLRGEVVELRDEVSRLRQQVEELRQLLT
jgi:uncharacterized protein YceH (UPF0502 family)